MSILIKAEKATYYHPETGWSRKKYDFGNFNAALGVWDAAIESAKEGWDVSLVEIDDESEAPDPENDIIGFEATGAEIIHRSKLKE